METIFSDHENRESLFKIEEAFERIASNKQILALFPEIGKVANRFYKDLAGGYSDQTETSFLNLYCEIHRAGSEYSEAERQRLDNKQGYFNHPGGISPLLRSKQHIHSDTVVADLGAGNGLQGLLFQYLYPHKRTELVELSTSMIKIGKLFQEALGIEKDKVFWINDDIINFDLDHIDFLYLYRPSKPIKNGIALYEDLRKKLGNRNRAVTIFSIADCLKDYLSDNYREFYNDGHLTCFRMDG